MIKMNKFIAAIAAACCLAASAAMLSWFLRSTGSDMVADSESASASIMSGFEVFVNNSSADALADITPIKKVYRLSEDTIVAPEPDQSRFGSTVSHAEVENVIDDAFILLEGEDTVFNSNIELMPGSKVNYYLDDSIMAITWKQAINDACYTFSEIKIADASQFRRYFANNSFGSAIQYRTSDMASTVNAVVAMSGDFYKYRPMGIVVYGRNVFRADGSEIDTCFIDTNGDLHFVRAGDITSQAVAEAYVKNNDILFSLSFGPILIEDGKNVCPDAYPIGEVNLTYSRAAIAQMGERHYLLVTINYEGSYLAASTVKQLADVLVDMGCPKAYTLDGGQTGTIVMNDKVINNVDYGEERYISDIFYFASAITN